MKVSCCWGRDRSRGCCLLMPLTMYSLMEGRSKLKFSFYFLFGWFVCRAHGLRAQCSLTLLCVCAIARERERKKHVAVVFVCLFCYYYSWFKRNEYIYSTHIRTPNSIPKIIEAIMTMALWPFFCFRFSCAFGGDNFSLALYHDIPYTYSSSS